MADFLDIIELALDVAQFIPTDPARGDQTPRSFSLDTQSTNAFGRPKNWYCIHCGTRNSGSVCRDCGAQRRDAI